MPSKLFKYIRKPKVVNTQKISFKFKEKDWKGAGLYYHRGHHKMQKFHVSKDLHITHATRLKNLKPKWRHIHDSKTIRRAGHRIGKV